MPIKCNTCAGIYDAVTPEGLAYFHACPPLRQLRVQELDGTYSTVDPGTQGVRRVVGERFTPRPNRRDENVRLNPTTGKSEPIATGAGVAPATDADKA